MAWWAHEEWFTTWWLPAWGSEASHGIYYAEQRLWVWDFIFPTTHRISDGNIFSSYVRNHLFRLPWGEMHPTKAWPQLALQQTFYWWHHRDLGRQSHRWMGSLQSRFEQFWHLDLGSRPPLERGWLPGSHPPDWRWTNCLQDISKTFEPIPIPSAILLSPPWLHQGHNLRSRRTVLCPEHLQAWLHLFHQTTVSTFTRQRMGQ